MDSSFWRLGVLTRNAADLDSRLVVRETGRQLSIAPLTQTSGANYYGYVSIQPSNLTNGSASILVAQKSGSSAETIFSIGANDRNFYRFRAKDKLIYMDVSVNGSVSTTSIASTTSPRCWRIRHNPSSDSIVFETGKSATSWETRRSVARGFDISNLYVEINAGTSASAATTAGAALFDNFELNSNGAVPLPTATPTATATPNPTPSPTATPTPLPTNGNSRGYLTTPAELAVVKTKAAQNVQPYKSAVGSLLSYAGSPTAWSYGAVDPTDRDKLQDAAALIYAKALAYHLTGNGSYAATVRQRILEISNTNTCPNQYSGGNGCILTLSRHIAGYIAAADLIEDYAGWTAQDKSRFQTWLRDDVYRFTDWASDERSTNWGSVGTMTTIYIADYLAGSGLNLIDRDGSAFTPHAAFVEARQRAFDRNNGNSYMYNSVCTEADGYGIQYHGGIPEETGRGSTGCGGTYLRDDDSSWSYMIAHLSGTLPTAELLLRRGDPSLYLNIKADGGGSILRAILFVIDNPYAPSGQYNFNWLGDRKSILEIAYRFYRHPSIAAQLGISGGTRHIAGGSNTAMPHFGTLTHGFSVSENPGPPPFVPAP